MHPSFLLLPLLAALPQKPQGLVECLDRVANDELIF